MGKHMRPRCDASNSCEQLLPGLERKIPQRSDKGPRQIFFCDDNWEEGRGVGCPSGTCDLNPLGTASRSPGRKDDDIISNVQAFCNAARQIIDRLSRKQTRMTSPCLLPALNNEGKLV